MEEPLEYLSQKIRNEIEGAQSKEPGMRIKKIEQKIEHFASI